MHVKQVSILFFLSLAFVLPAIGQELPQGKFINSTGFTYEEFTFKKNLKFEYQSGSCTGGQEGAGTYILKNGLLILTFENPRDTTSLKHKLSIIRQQAHSDTSNLQFNLFDQNDSTALEGVVVRYINKNTDKMIGSFSNAKGQATVRVKNSEFPIEVNISCVEMKSKLITLDSSGNYSITCPLSFKFKQSLIEGDTLKFVLKEFTDDELLLRPIGQENFRVYKKRRSQ
jgi:hypothetical protein